MNRLASRDFKTDPEQPAAGAYREQIRRADDSEQMAALRQLKASANESFGRGLLIGFLAALLVLGALSLQATQPAATEFDGVPPMTNEVPNE